MLLILDSFNGMRNIAAPNNARMAELVDASDSKSGIRKDVQVRFLFRAPKPNDCTIFDITNRQLINDFTILYFLVFSF